jgi:hypothetical protein
MTRKVTEVMICDRCGGEYSVHSPRRTISGLSYMLIRNGGGSQDSNMALDLCGACTIAFEQWWRKGKTN